MFLDKNLVCLNSSVQSAVSMFLLNFVPADFDEGFFVSLVVLTVTIYTLRHKNRTVLVIAHRRASLCSVCFVRELPLFMHSVHK